MPALARLGDAVVTGHPCDVISSILGGLGLNTKVTAQGSLVSVTGDLVAPHTILISGGCTAHNDATVIGTSIKVTVQGIPVCRIGDPADLGAIISGSPKVFVGS